MSEDNSKDIQIVVVTHDPNRYDRLVDFAEFPGPVDKITNDLREISSEGATGRYRTYLDDPPPINTFLPPKMVKASTKTSSGDYFLPIQESIRRKIGNTTSVNLFSSLCQVLDYDPDYPSFLSGQSQKFVPSKLYSLLAAILESISSLVLMKENLPKRFAICNMYSRLGTRPGFQREFLDFLESAKSVLDLDVPQLEVLQGLAGRTLGQD